MPAGVVSLKKSKVPTTPFVFRYRQLAEAELFAKYNAISSPMMMKYFNEKEAQEGDKKLELLLFLKIKLK